MILTESKPKRYLVEVPAEFISGGQLAAGKRYRIVIQAIDDDTAAEELQEAGVAKPGQTRRT